MGTVVCHWEDFTDSAIHTSSVLDQAGLRLTAIAAVDSFHYRIIDSAGSTTVSRGLTSGQRYHFFDRPLGYLDEVIAQDEILCADFEQVHLALRGIPFVMMPGLPIRKSEIRARLAEVTEINQHDQVFADKVDEHLAIGFAISQKFVEEAKTWFSQVQIHHVITAIISRMLGDPSLQTGLHMLLNAHQGFVEIVLCHNGRLAFANHYRISAQSDILYYVLAAAELREIPVADLQVCCSGTLAVDMVETLSVYLPQVRLYPDSVTGDVHETRIMDLISVAQCAS